MLSRQKGLVAALLLIGASTVESSAMAEEAVIVPVAKAAAPAVQPFGGKLLDPSALAKQRGGTDPGVLSDLKLNGVVSDNRASNLVTGNNAITDGALSGASGVPLVVQNTGNNVLIQSATIINVQLK